MSSFNPDEKKMPTEPDLAVQIKAQLIGGERLLWTGKPSVSRVFRTAFVIYLFAIPWTAFSLFWELMAAGSIWKSIDKMPAGMGLGMAIVFPLFGLPFIAIGFWLLAKPFSIRRKAANTIFAVTSKRALIYTKGSKQEVLSFPFENMNQIFDRKENSDGSGSLIFSLKNGTKQEGAGDLFLRGFEYVADVKGAEAALRRAMGTAVVEDAGGENV